MPRRKKAAPIIKVSEANLSKYIQDILKLDEWRVFRMESVSDRRRGRGFGELGMPDLLLLRYPAQVLWLEVKTLGGRVAPHQRIWINAERERGAVVWLAGEDFPATIDGFLAHYRESGLLRRKGLC